MIINFIELKNFRLHKNTKLNFSENLNYIVGGNGQGKTSILEAIYYLCTTKSINQVSDSEAVTFDEKGFEIIGNFSDLTNNSVRVYYDLENQKKNYFLDQKNVYRASTVIGKFPVVTLTQSDHSVTMGSPGDRRKFVDSVLSQCSATYLDLLLEYNKTLRQRSSLLSQIKDERSKSLYDQLDVWTETLIKTGTELIKHRIRFVEDYTKYVRESYYHLMAEDEVPDIEYFFLKGEESISSIEESFRNLLNEIREDELRRASNLAGPHRDDFIFFINDMELKKFGSQGQHKTFQIALRFGQFFYIKDALGRKPIFLLDDVFGELDMNRAKKISEYLRKVGQAIITMTDLSNLEKLGTFEDDLIINVSNGKAAYV
ncbi:MAG: DNA replication and repair protein RecF [Melioribacteraceae bacterium]|nr:DNA replication and repair protein RecF [Melioribacteraceae bacterium]